MLKIKTKFKPIKLPSSNSNFYFNSEIQHQPSNLNPENKEFSKIEKIEKYIQEINSVYLKTIYKENDLSIYKSIQDKALKMVYFNNTEKIKNTFSRTSNEMTLYELKYMFNFIENNLIHSIKFLSCNNLQYNKLLNNFGKCFELIPDDDKLNYIVFFMLLILQIDVNTDEVTSLLEIIIKNIKYDYYLNEKFVSHLIDLSVKGYFKKLNFYLHIDLIHLINSIEINIEDIEILKINLFLNNILSTVLLSDFFNKQFKKNFFCLVLEKIVTLKELFDKNKNQKKEIISNQFYNNVNYGLINKMQYLNCFIDELSMNIKFNSSNKYYIKFCEVSSIILDNENIETKLKITSNEYLNLWKRFQKNFSPEEITMNQLDFILSSLTDIIENSRRFKNMLTSNSNHRFLCNNQYSLDLYSIIQRLKQESIYDTPILKNIKIGRFLYNTIFSYFSLTTNYNILFSEVIKLHPLSKYFKKQIQKLNLNSNNKEKIITMTSIYEYLLEVKSDDSFMRNFLLSQDQINICIYEIEFLYKIDNILMLISNRLPYLLQFEHEYLIKKKFELNWITSITTNTDVFLENIFSCTFEYIAKHYESLGESIKHNTDYICLLVNISLMSLSLMITSRMNFIIINKNLSENILGYITYFSDTFLNEESPLNEILLDTINNSKVVCTCLKFLSYIKELDKINSEKFDERSYKSYITLLLKSIINKNVKELINDELSFMKNRSEIFGLTIKNSIKTEKKMNNRLEKFCLIVTSLFEYIYNDILYYPKNSFYFETNKEFNLIILILEEIILKHGFEFLFKNNPSQVDVTNFLLNIYHILEYFPKYNSLRQDIVVYFTNNYQILKNIIGLNILKLDNILLNQKSIFIVFNNLQSLFVSFEESSFLQTLSGNLNYKSMIRSFILNIYNKLLEIKADEAKRVDFFDVLKNKIENGNFQNNLTHDSGENSKKSSIQEYSLRLKYQENFKSFKDEMHFYSFTKLLFNIIDSFSIIEIINILSIIDNTKPENYSPEFIFYLSSTFDKETLKQLSINNNKHFLILCLNWPLFLKNNGLIEILLTQPKKNFLQIEVFKVINLISENCYRIEHIFNAFWSSISKIKSISLKKEVFSLFIENCFRVSMSFSQEKYEHLLQLFNEIRKQVEDLKLNAIQEMIDKEIIVKIEEMKFSNNDICNLLGLSVLSNINYSDLSSNHKGTYLFLVEVLIESIGTNKVAFHQKDIKKEEEIIYHESIKSYEKIYNKSVLFGFSKENIPFNEVEENDELSVNEEKEDSIENVIKENDDEIVGDEKEEDILNQIKSEESINALKALSYRLSEPKQTTIENEITEYYKNTEYIIQESLKASQKDLQFLKKWALAKGMKIILGEQIQKNISNIISNVMVSGKDGDVYNTFYLLIFQKCLKYNCSISYKEIEKESEIQIDISIKYLDKKYGMIFIPKDFTIKDSSTGLYSPNGYYKLLISLIQRYNKLSLFIFYENEIHDNFDEFEKSAEGIFMNITENRNNLH